ncbi:MAG: hypothetical protein Q4Q00_03035 [Turicibacter sp.]|nr:hypothetical protein [Turicibacter sp.]
MEEIYTYVDVVFESEQIEPFAMKCEGDYVAEVFEEFTRLSPDIASFSVSTQAQNHSYVEVSGVVDLASWFSTVYDYSYYLTVLQELKENGVAKM